MFDLNGRVALITGATGGIGGAIARKMKEAGATVVVSGRNTAKLDANSAMNTLKFRPIYQPTAGRSNWL